ncbi:MAG TPA: hypothetical protein PK867_10940 [Pirellulales bacterium]|nr:hypothetical protein [Pirellulales bacterium]
MHSAESQRLLNELAVAKLCLLNAERKYAYDTEIMSKQRSPLVAPQAKWPVIIPKAVDPAPIEVAPPAKRRRPKIVLPDVVPTPSDAHKTLLFAAGIAGIAVAGFVFYKTRDHSSTRLEITPEKAASANKLVKDDAEKAREIVDTRTADASDGVTTAAGGLEPTTAAPDDFFADDTEPTPPPKAASDDPTDFFADGDTPDTKATGTAAPDSSLDDFFDRIAKSPAKNGSRAAAGVDPKVAELSEWVFSKGSRLVLHASDGGSITARRSADLPFGDSYITEINFHGCPVGDADMQRLEDVKGDLQKLWLSGTKVTDSGMSRVGKLQEL